MESPEIRAKRLSTLFKTSEEEYYATIKRILDQCPEVPFRRLRDGVERKAFISCLLVYKYHIPSPVVARYYLKQKDHTTIAHYKKDVLRFVKAKNFIQEEEIISRLIWNELKDIEEIKTACFNRRGVVIKLNKESYETYCYLKEKYGS